MAKVLFGASIVLVLASILQMIACFHFDKPQYLIFGAFCFIVNLACAFMNWDTIKMEEGLHD